MNTEPPAFIMENMLHVRLARFASTGCSEGTTPENVAADAHADREDFADHADLAELTRETTLEQSQPVLLKNLMELLQVAEPLLPDVEDALDNLKEAFLALLRVRLAESGIDTDTRLVLGLHGAGCLGVADESHPRACELNGLLARTPELSAAMREIARQSRLLRGLQNIENAVYDAPDGQERGLSANATFFGMSPYYVCLRGALSHFYVPRQ